MELPIALGQVIANKYRVDRVIGTGGMGVVFAAFHMELDQPVAIKFLSAGPGLKHEAGVRFRREAQAAAKIHSEHVVRVFDVGLFEDTFPYLVMELLEGNDLEQEVETRGAIPLEEAVSYVLQAIDAVAEAHAVGIIHRDLKPTNLYLTLRADGTRTVKVLDFGISKSIISRPREVALTRTAAFVGSPLFMSPEQMRSARDVDARTDIWALGTILYALLTAELPYNRESLPELCVAIMSEPPRPLTELLPAIPPELERIVLKCLARERSDRYASVAELAAELAPFVPQMRPYAERAARVLSRGGESSSSALGAAALSRVPTPAAVPADERSLASSLVQNTQLAWDKAGRRTFMKRGIPVIAAAAAAVIGGLAALIYFLHKDPSAPVEPALPLTLTAHAAQAAGSKRDSTSSSDRVDPAPSPATTPQVDTDKATPTPPFQEDGPALPAAKGKVSGSGLGVGGPTTNRSHPRVVKPTGNSAVAKTSASSTIPDLGGRVF